MKVAGWVVAAGVALAWLASCNGYRDSVAEADRFEASADSLQRVADSLHVATQAALQRDSIRAATYTADSARWATERALAARRIENARANAQVAREELVARLDSAEVAMLERYDADRDSIDNAMDDAIQAVTEDRDALQPRIGSLTDALDATRAELATAQTQVMLLRAANESLREAIRSQATQATAFKLVTVAGVLYVGARVLGG